MASLKSFFNPDSYSKFIERRLLLRRIRLEPNMMGTVNVPPGHYYSPLLDIESLKPEDTALTFDSEEMWENLDLRPNEQRAYYSDLLSNYPFPDFPKQKTDGFRYYTGNHYFETADAFTLSGIIRREKPSRIIEVGSGFSSAVMLDTLQRSQLSTTLTFIEPFPDRLNSLLDADDRARTTILVKQVQEVPIGIFEDLEEHDVLFIDSSHVAKIGSDLTFLLLRILPKLKPGVLIHFHDIFYPYTYPVEWIREGRAWNESLFLRAFLLHNLAFEIVAFNSFAGHSFPELFSKSFPQFLDNTGGSIWLKKVR